MSEQDRESAVGAAWDFVKDKLGALNAEKGTAGVWSNGFRSGYDAATRAKPTEGLVGMTLRDYFSGQALAAVQGTNPNLPDDPASTRFFPESHELARRQATWSYLVADAMLAERSKP